jgi:hypothetical protein
MDPVEPSSDHNAQNFGDNGQDDDNRVPEGHADGGVPVEAHKAVEQLQTPYSRSTDKASTKMYPDSGGNRSNPSVQLFVSIGHSAPTALQIGKVRDDAELFAELNRCYYAQRSFKDRIYGMVVPKRVQFNKVGRKIADS